jgi:CheY-like chemotaxis protein
MARILLIEDDDNFRKMLKLTLTDVGYEVIEATDGEQGIDLYRRQPADLVVTDIIMPNKEGTETIIQLKKEFPDVKIVAISGGGLTKSDVYLRVANLLGVERTFSKPFDKSEFLQTLAALMTGGV